MYSLVQRLFLQQEHFQYQTVITLCKRNYVDAQNTINVHNIENNPLAINLDVSGCSGANN